MVFIMCAGKRIGYVRVSTTEQNPDRQLEGVSLDKKFIDYASGTTMNRPQLQVLIEYAREDDIIIVHSMDRLARNVKDLLKLIDVLIFKKISIQFMKENLLFNGEDSPMSKLLLMLMGSIAEFEHSVIRERQIEGIEIAKRCGKYKGRKSKFSKEKAEQIKEKMQTRQTKMKIAKDLGISRFTLYRYLEKIKTENEKVAV